VQNIENKTEIRKEKGEKKLKKRKGPQGNELA
jgi:hypothetical protein